MVEGRRTPVRRRTGAILMTTLQPAGMVQVLSRISELSGAVGPGGIELLKGDGAFADALASAVTSTADPHSASGNGGLGTGTGPSSGPSSGSMGMNGIFQAGDTATTSGPGMPSSVLLGLGSTPATGSGSGAMTPPAPLEAVFAAATAEYRLPAGLLEAVATQESGMNPNAVSSAGAEGIMQLMPATATANGVANPFDPAEAIPGAARILAGNLAHFGSVPLALAAYNAGAGAVERYGGIPPYPQTETYVSSIMAMLGGSS